MTVASIRVALDIGNSAVKAVAQSNNTNGSESSSKQSASTIDPMPSLDPATVKSFPIGSSDADQSGRLGIDVSGLLSWLAPLLGNNHPAEPADLCFAVSTVNRSVSKPLRSQLESSLGSVRWHELSHSDIPLQIEVRYPDRVGVDRLLSAYAASAYAAINQFNGGCVVVDAGSAVTIDLVTPTRRSDAAAKDDLPIFHGGAILPGVRMQQAALAGGTDNLPSIKAMDEQNRPNGSTNQAQPGGQVGNNTSTIPTPPAKETEAAIRLGVLSAITGAIEKLADEYSRYAATLSTDADLNGKIAVVISGGDADLISRHLRISHIVKHNLVCQGILDLAGRECFGSASRV
ncbi:type III pantothenate kinase [Stieleria sp. JC731]|uniref:type III pantothenate kinase n=1 Tax=Pirellulaceae TaxID=2691357 RepID=UPI001E297329|nr:type III pantothenate kinase [Stieleria sp. JC731]MCC9599191.1 type III pantothenate kinase [Stieleria sp. JC731]